MGGTNPFPHSVCLFPHTLGLKMKTNYSLQFFFYFWQALQILTCHIFFWSATYSTSDIFATDEIILT